MRLLLVKLSALGDVIHALPTLRALREGLGARVDWLVEEEQADLLRGHPLIDRLLVCPRRRWLRELRRGEVRGVVRELAGFLRELRAVEYGVVLDLQGLLKSALWTRLARAGRRVGLGTAREGSAWVLDERVPCDLNLHAVDRYLTAARYLGDEAPLMPVIVRQKEETEQFLDMVAENLVRADVDPVSEGLHYRRLLQEPGMTRTRLSRETGVATATINDRLRLLDLEPEVRDLIAANRFPRGRPAVEALLSIPDSRTRVETAQALADWDAAPGKFTKILIEVGE